MNNIIYYKYILYIIIIYVCRYITQLTWYAITCQLHCTISLVAYILNSSYIQAHQETMQLDEGHLTVIVKHSWRMPQIRCSASCYGGSAGGSHPCLFFCWLWYSSWSPSARTALWSTPCPQRQTTATARLSQASRINSELWTATHSHPLLMQSPHHCLPIITYTHIYVYVVFETFKYHAHSVSQGQHFNISRYSHTINSLECVMKENISCVWTIYADLWTLQVLA